MSELAFIDTCDAAAQARQLCPDAQLVTDNPLLAADPNLTTPVENIDARVTQAQANKIATAAVDIATAIDAALTKAGIDRRPGLYPGHLQLAGTTSRLLSSLLYRAAVVANHLRRQPATRLPLIICDAPRVDPLQPFHLPYLASPLRPLAEAGFFAKTEIKLAVQPTPALSSINDTTIDDVIGRMALLPLPVILFDLAHRLRLPMPGPRGPLFVLGENDTLRETLPWLATKGFAIRRLGRLQSNRIGKVATDQAEISFSDPLPRDGEIAAAIDPWLRDHIATLDIFDAPQSAALAQVTLTHLSAGMARLTAQTPEITSRLQQALAGTSNPVILSNGLFGPVGAQIYGACKSLGATIIDFEHGTTVGLSAASQGRIDFGEVTTCDSLFCCSEQSRQAFAAAAQAPQRNLRTVGVADQERQVLRRPLQRQRAARRVPPRYRKRNTIMHVSTLLWGGNMRATIDPPTETRIWQTDHALITQVYERLDKPVLFKPYPTRRFAHQPDYAHMLPDLANVAILSDEDFRYLRALPAILVSSAPTGTLGWCAGADRPLVYLGSHCMNTLLDASLRQQFQAAFFYIDLDREEWPDTLLELLQQPLTEIENQWQAKAPARAELTRQALAGPSQPGRNAARMIAGLAAKPQTARLAGENK